MTLNFTGTQHCETFRQEMTPVPYGPWAAEFIINIILAFA